MSGEDTARARTADCELVAEQIVMMEQPAKTTVIHVRDMQPGDVYIGRAMPRQRLKGSPFANPFKIGEHGDREEVIHRYYHWLLDSHGLIELIPTLRGKRLACWCAPQACHGDVLAELADAERM